MKKGITMDTDEIRKPGKQYVLHWGPCSKCMAHSVCNTKRESKECLEFLLKLDEEKNRISIGMIDLC